MSVLVTGDSGSETDSTGSFARGVDSPGESLLHVLQELGLRETWIPDNQRVDVSSDAVLACSNLLLPTHQTESDRSLDMPHAINGRCHRCNEALADVWALCELENLLLLIVADLHEFQVALPLEVNGLDVGSIHREARSGIRGGVIEAAIDTCKADLISRSDSVHLVACENDLLGSRHLARLDGAWGFLQRNLLVVLVDSLLTVYTPRALGLALDAGAGFQLLLF
mmetsp:Transcript_8446/g.13377  ORF Transcript_8446/g.13377 Transcript_8446/m.13377 type:complete len:225 (+) Transcript_8446:981-1655(+)